MIEEEAFFSEWFQKQNELIASLEDEIKADSSDEVEKAIQLLQKISEDLNNEDPRLTQLCRQIQVAAEKQDKHCRALTELTIR